MSNRGRVRVEHDEAVLATVERRAANLVDAVPANNDGEVVVLAPHVFWRRVGEGFEPHLIGVDAVLFAGDLDKQRQALWVLFGRARLQNGGSRRVGHAKHRLRHRIAQFVGHGPIVRPIADPRRAVGPGLRSRHDGLVPRVLLVLPSSTYRAEAFLAAANALGIDVVTGSDAPQAMEAVLPGRFIVLPLRDPAAAADIVADFASSTPLDAVVAVDDEGLLAAAAAAERLGLTKNPYSAVEATRDKAAMRRLLEEHGVSEPRFEVIEAGDDEQLGVVEAAARIGYPAVVKPTTLSASRGVVRVDNADEARSAAATVRTIAAKAGCRADEALLVEEFVPGDEIAIEALLVDGDLEVLAVFDKPDPLNGPYFEETMYVTPSRHENSVLDAACRVVADACRAIGLVDGPVHAEARLSPSGADLSSRVVVLEAAARTIGGKCSKALRFASDHSLEQIVLAHAVGVEVEERARESEASGVVMLPIPSTGRFLGIDGVADALSVKGVSGLDVTVPEGRTVSAWPEGDRYLGFLFARGAKPADVEESLRKAQAHLFVRISPEGDGAK